MTLVGRRGPRWRFPIEWSKVWEFAHAVHDDHADGDPLLVPPTFPAYGLSAFEPFFGSAAAGFDMEKVLHAEEAYEYTRALRIGDVLACETEIVEERFADGRRGGTLRFVVTETLMRDERRELVVRTRTTMVQTHATRPAGAAAHARDASAPSSEVDPAPDRALALGPPPAFTFGPLTRVDIVRYAGATYDFVPLHHDDEYARAAGYPTVFAHGMLAAGLLASFVTRWCGPGSVRSYGVRMREQVWPGDTLTARGRIVGAPATTRDGDREVNVEIELLRQDGAAAVTGRARVAVER